MFTEDQVILAKRHSPLCTAGEGKNNFSDISRLHFILAIEMKLPITAEKLQSGKPTAMQSKISEL